MNFLKINQEKDHNFGGDRIIYFYKSKFQILDFLVNLLYLILDKPMSDKGCQKNIIEITDEGDKQTIKETSSSAKYQSQGLDQQTYPKLYQLLQRYKEKGKEIVQAQQKDPLKGFSFIPINKGELEVTSIVHINPASNKQISIEQVKMSEEPTLYPPISHQLTIQEEALSLDYKSKECRQVAIEPTYPKITENIVIEQDRSGKEQDPIQLEIVQDFQPQAIEEYTMPVQKRPLENNEAVISIILDTSNCQEPKNDNICIANEQHAQQLKSLIQPPNESIYPNISIHQIQDPINIAHTSPSQNPPAISAAPQRQEHIVVSSALQAATTTGLDYEGSIDQLKRKIIMLLPDMESTIHTISEKEVVQVYNAIKSEMKMDIMTENIDQLVENANKSNLNQRSEPINLDEDRIQERIGMPIVVAIQQGKIAQKEEKSICLQDGAKEGQKVINASPFQSMKNCDGEELRRQMLHFFPQAKESLEQMNHQQLKGVLNDALKQYKNEKEIICSQNSITNINPTNNPSLNEMKQALKQLIPTMATEIVSFDETYIKELYAYASVDFKDPERKRHLLKKITTEGKLAHSSILKACLQKFPYLKEELMKLTEQQLNKIYEQIQSKIISPPNAPANTVHNTKCDPPQIEVKTAISQPISGANLKRTHEAMMETNPTKTIRPVENENKSEIKKKKINSSDLRAKLIAKLPELKDNIMKLDDKEIQKIFKESIQNTKSQTSRKSLEEVKPVIVIQQGKIHSEAYKQPQENGASEIVIDAHQTTQEKTRVFQVKDPLRKKKTKTIVLMHTEEEDDQIEVGYKLRKTNGGVEKRCNCECCKKLDIRELLRRLADMVDSN